jgi:hypothetical protein
MTIKHVLAAAMFITLVAVGVVAQVCPPLAAFYGAQGGGALSVGGRGGTVYLVTNTNDSGTGSLRACAEEATGARTCIFRTGGTINLQNQISIAAPYLTIAGQSAPGGGIQITGTSTAISGNPLLQITTHDVLIQYVRLRRGHNNTEQCASTCGANFVLFSNSGTTDPSKIVIDHVSSEWSNYESSIGLGATVAPNPPRLITMSRSIFGEALAGAGQVTIQEVGGYSGAGPTAPDLMTDIDLHHSLLAGGSHRYPLWTQKSGRSVNNILYGWTYYASRSKGLRDFVNNYYKLRNGQTIIPGHEISAWTENALNDTSVAPSFWVTGNVGPNDPAGTNNWNNMTALASSQSGSEVSLPLATTYQRSAPIPTPAGYIPITVDLVSDISSSGGSMLNISRAPPYDGVGASRRLDCSSRWVDMRDSVDVRITTAVVNGTTLYGTYTYDTINTSPQSQGDLGGFPTEAAGTACVDANNNGMPDVWESYWAGVFGLGTTLAPNATNFGDGYTNLEHYLDGRTPSP